MDTDGFIRFMVGLGLFVVAWVFYGWWITRAPSQPTLAQMMKLNQKEAEDVTRKSRKDRGRNS